MKELSILKGMAETLRLVEWPDECRENAETAMIYLDCATQNLAHARQPQATASNDVLKSYVPETYVPGIRHHVKRVQDLENYPATCGSTIWERATTLWDEVTCPECLKQKPANWVTKCPECGQRHTWHHLRPDSTPTLTPSPTSTCSETQSQAMIFLQNVVQRCVQEGLTRPQIAAGMVDCLKQVPEESPKKV